MVIFRLKDIGHERICENERRQRTVTPLTRHRGPATSKIDLIVVSSERVSAAQSHTRTQGHTRYIHLPALRFFLSLFGAVSTPRCPPVRVLSIKDDISRT